MNDYFTGLAKTLEDIPSDVIQQVIRVLHKARLSKRSIYIMGNGGSASTASHFAADLSKNTFNQRYPSIRAISLSENMATFSAYANDEGYENVFARQVANLANPGDVIIAISASGNSMNVLRAVELANQMGTTTIGFTGYEGGKLGNLVDIHLNVPNNVIEQVEDIHLLLEHMICKTLRENADEITRMVTPSFALTDDLKITGNSFHIDTQNAGFRILQTLSGEDENEFNLQGLLRLSLKLSLEGVNADSGSIIILDDNGHVVDAMIAYNQNILVPSFQDLDGFVDSGLAGWVFRNKQAALVEDTRTDPRWLKRTWDEGGSQPRSAISVPLIGQEGVSGVLTLVNSNSNQFNHGHMVLLLAFSTLISYGKKTLQ